MLAIGSLLIAVLAVQGGSDPTRAARTAYTGCLRQFVDRSMQGGMTQEAFEAAWPQQCQQQKAAFRAAIIARENALRATRANAEETADLEIEDSEVNQRDMFVAAEPAPAAQPAAQQAAATTTPATPPATPASQPTPQ